MSTLSRSRSVALSDGQAGLIGTRVKPGAMALLVARACVGNGRSGTPPSSRAQFRDEREFLSIQANGPCHAHALFTRGTNLMRKKKLGYAKPLPMPAFGSPADGRQCSKCGRWFHRAHFWRSSTKVFVQKCADCSLPRRMTNTGNSGRPKSAPEPWTPFLKKEA
jgi:hypothetical protein